MDHDRYPDALIASLLEGTRAVALVGASPDPARASHGVMAWWLRRGVRVVPVNPGLAGGAILGQPVVATLAEVPDAIDLVDVFRRSDAAGGVVAEVLALSPPAPDAVDAARRARRPRGGAGRGGGAHRDHGPLPRHRGRAPRRHPTEADPMIDVPARLGRLAW